MSIDDLKKECQYCCLEIDASGLEGFRCTNRTVIKTTNSSWCYPKNADMPCSTCEYCYPKQDMKMSIDRAIEIINHYLDYPYEEVREALLLAINTMHKYQKIEEIARWNNAPSPYYKPDGQLFREIEEVLENGNVD